MIKLKLSRRRQERIVAQPGLDSHAATADGDPSLP
jgi:hypothetical protein